MNTHRGTQPHENTGKNLNKISTFYPSTGEKKGVGEDTEKPTFSNTAGRRISQHSHFEGHISVVYLN